MLPGDLDLDDQVVIVLGKGRRPRAVPFGRKTALALDRYLRMRASHPFAHLPNLWLGRAGAMTPSGLFQIVAARGAAASLPGLHPHQFRHSFADSWLSAGGNESDLMRLAGWRSRQMVAAVAGADAGGFGQPDAGDGLAGGDQGGIRPPGAFACWAPRRPAPDPRRWQAGRRRRSGYGRAG